MRSRWTNFPSPPSKFTLYNIAFFLLVLDFFPFAVIYYFVQVNFLQFMLGLDIGCCFIFVASLIGLEAL